jgi:thiol-disulfide isomerase/thioredoxin
MAPFFIRVKGFLQMTGAVIALIAVVTTGAMGQIGGIPPRGMGLREQVRYLKIEGAEASIPFRLYYIQRKPEAPEMALLNGSERLELKTKLVGDTIVADLHVFDGELHLADDGNGGLAGNYYRQSPTGVRRFVVRSYLPKQDRMAKPYKPIQEKRFAVTFSDKDGKNAYKAIGHVEDLGVKAIGTFETTTGDYRFLEGERIRDSLWLSCFDGTHAFLFTARVVGAGKSQRLTRGRFYGLGSGYEKWEGYVSKTEMLPDALSLSKPIPQAKVVVNGLDTTGMAVTLTDARFAGKAVVVQVLGTWCPNCMDETAYLAKWYGSKPSGVEVLGLAFERRNTIEWAAPRIKRLTKAYVIPYPIVLAGQASADSASAAMPFITKVAAFPTTLFLDRDHVVRYVHTGFSGPATGAAFTRWEKEFAQLVERIRN